MFKLDLFCKSLYKISRSAGFRLTEVRHQGQYETNRSLVVIRRAMCHEEVRFYNLRHKQLSITLRYFDFGHKMTSHATATLDAFDDKCKTNQPKSETRVLTVDKQ